MFTARSLMLWVAVLSACCAAGSAIAAEGDTTLTIYSSARPGAIPPEMYRPVPGEPMRFQTLPGYAVVKQERRLDLQQGRNHVRFTDVAALIDPTTVHFSSLTDPQGTHVLEQGYEFDLVSSEALLERYLDQNVVVEQARGDHIATFEGTLLSTSGGLILKLPGGAVQVINGYTNVRFPELPGGLITRPTLIWDLAANQPGAHRTRVSYQTGGMTWWADYNITYSEQDDANQGTLDLGAWVSIINRSGAGYENCRLKLIAGDVHRAPQPEMMGMPMQLRGRAAAADAQGFVEQAFFEYHLYTLGRPTTLKDNATRQIELFPPASGVPCRKILVYEGLAGQYFRFSGPMTERSFGTQGNTKVDVYLRFKNARENHLGMPLPAGRIRVNKLDPADGSLEFIGEDVIDHTPRDETVLIRMGTAFDVVGERKQLNFRIDTSRKWMEEELEINLRNHKEQRVEVLVREKLHRWQNWRITANTQDYEKIDSNTVHFPLVIDPHGEVVVRYTVRYTW